MFRAQCAHEVARVFRARLQTQFFDRNAFLRDPDFVAFDLDDAIENVTHVWIPLFGELLREAHEFIDFFARLTARDHFFGEAHAVFNRFRHVRGVKRRALRSA